MTDTKRKANWAANKEREDNLWWSVLRSRDKWHLTSMLLADMLKQASPEEFHAEINGILETTKDEIANMYMDYHRRMKEEKDAKG
jgi:hypothetical protein